MKRVEAMCCPAKLSAKSLMDFKSRNSGELTGKMEIVHIWIDNDDDLGVLSAFRYPTLRFITYWTRMMNEITANLCGLFQIWVAM